MNQEKDKNSREEIRNLNTEELSKVSGGEGDGEDPRLPVIPYEPKTGKGK